MRGGGPLWSLSGSLLLHALALAAALVLVSREMPPGVLIVELEEAVRVGEPGPPALPARPASARPAVRRAPSTSVEPSPSVATFPLVQEPPAVPAHSPGPAVPVETARPSSVSGPLADATAEAPHSPPGSEGGGGGAIVEAGGGGIPGPGPLAMLAPSGRGSGEGAAGGEGGVPAEFGPYLAAFRQRIQEALSYPLAARRRGLGGTVHLEVELLPTGKVASVTVRSSSSHTVLDQAAVETVSQLSPLPFPPGVPLRPLKIRLPIVFELR